MKETIVDGSLRLKPGGAVKDLTKTTKSSKISLSAKADADWITINGTHVQVDEDGNLQGSVGERIAQTSKPNEYDESTTVRAGHPELDGINATMDEKVDSIMKRVGEQSGYTQADAAAAVPIITNYSLGGYDYIHNPITPRGVEANKVINKTLEALPKYDGPIYRGVKLPGNIADEQFKELKSGNPITLGSGATSFSSDIKVSEEFASDNAQGRRSIVYTLKKTYKAASITDVSGYGHHEKEVLSPGEVSYTLDGKITTDSQGRYIVPLKEV
jgi:hypothetical protein